MHYDLTPAVQFTDAQKALTALAGYYQGGNAKPDLGCTVKAAGLVVCFGSTFLPHDGMYAAPDDYPDCDKAKLLLEAANSDPAGEGMKALNWLLIVQIALGALSVLIPLVRK